MHDLEYLPCITASPCKSYFIVVRSPAISLKVTDRLDTRVKRTPSGTACRLQPGVPRGCSSSHSKQLFHNACNTMRSCASTCWTRKQLIVNCLLLCWLNVAVCIVHLPSELTLTAFPVHFYKTPARLGVEHLQVCPVAHQPPPSPGPPSALG